ncbi:MAG: M23 family metallopeptidase [Woeseiaceae bacterium]|nr:M23 family metallopeptidase [Woeseiaceae bacterium]
MRAAVIAFLLIALAAAAAAQTLYRYKGEDGEWIYADRPPDDGQVEEVRELKRSSGNGTVSTEVRAQGRAFHVVATNDLHAPVELQLRFTRITGVEPPHPDLELNWVVPARSSETLLELPISSNGRPPAVEYDYQYVIGDPNAAHRPDTAYRAPFAIASDYRITQAYPDVNTHNTLDSFYAVDFAMPIGTDIFAAREGTVFKIAATNFTSGLDPQRDGPSANVVQILHDDGTYAVYAHLHTNSIRVRPGDRVERGEYIADSGNTGFSSGPHLHFAVIRNVGMRAESVPVRFEGADTSAVTPASGNYLTAH